MAFNSATSPAYFWSMKATKASLAGVPAASSMKSSAKVVAVVGRIWMPPHHFNSLSRYDPMFHDGGPAASLSGAIADRQGDREQGKKRSKGHGSPQVPAALYTRHAAVRNGCGSIRIGPPDYLRCFWTAGQCLSPALTTAASWGEPVLLHDTLITDEFGVALMKTLLVSLAELPRVSTLSAEAYAKVSAKLVEKVNVRMAARASTQNLLGEAPVWMMFDNHKHHTLFMANVYRLNAFNMMAKIVPWVYRSYKARGFTDAYFPAAFEEWIRGIEELVPPEAAAELVPAYHWFQQNHERISHAASGPLVPAQDAGKDSDACREFTAALIAGDSKKVLQMAMANGGSSDLLQGFYRNLVQPSLYQVGTLWEQGAISVAEEHLASALVTRAMTAQYVALEVPEPTKGLVVVTAAQNEFHEIGAWMVANALEMDGWDVRYLGANTPIDDLMELLVNAPPRILAISIGMPFNLADVARLIQRVRATPELGNVRIMVGGLLFHHFPEMEETLGADAYGADCDAAVRIANQCAAELRT